MNQWFKPDLTIIQFSNLPFKKIVGLDKDLIKALELANYREMTKI